MKLNDRAHRLGTSASYVQLRATWTDLSFLPQPQLDKLNEVAARVRQTSIEDLDDSVKEGGSSGSVLFEGASTDARRITAETLARELDFDLYRIDLSTMVNKFIGESEKNLKRVFDAASDGGMILLFDEADALFGKRTEVKDSHDRFSNNEISYLLERMELFKGVAILATNRREGVDEDFMGRFSHVVQFSVSERKKRKSFWRRMFSRSSLRGLWC